MKLTTVIYSELQGKSFAQEYELSEIRIDYISRLIEFVGKDDSGEEVWFSTRLEGSNE